MRKKSNRDRERISQASTHCAKQSYYYVHVLEAQGGHIKLDRYNALHCNDTCNELKCMFHFESIHEHVGVTCVATGLRIYNYGYSTHTIYVEDAHID